MRYSSLSELLTRHKSGEPLGIYSVCSAHPFVVETALKRTRQDDSLLLIEATSNQVDQFGGYTGMRPADFIAFVLEKAARAGVDSKRIIFGGDHLGPNTWQGLPAQKAMEHATLLIAEYVKAGFTKIHLDTSMRCGDDPEGPLDPQVVAERAASLCSVAEAQASVTGSMPTYIIGTEVPVPGGAHESLHELVPSDVADVAETIQIHEDAFAKQNLSSAWERVMGVVVQPGVEFGSEAVIDYRSDRAQALSRLIEDHDHLIYEAHSTDYQLPDNLRQLVMDHYAILKVGPQLTYALRESLFALTHIEQALAAGHPAWQLSELFKTIGEVMDANPKYWAGHYHGNSAQQNYDKFYSLSDRVRYYWTTNELQSAVQRLATNLSAAEIPLSLLSQYLPQEYQLIREGQLQNCFQDLISFKIDQVLSTYAAACGISPIKAGEVQ